MTANEYEQGGLSQLITKRTNKKSKTNAVETSDSKLENVFSDPSAHEYEVKYIDIPEEPKENISNPTEERRKEVREKSKLVKMRQKEKLDTGHRTVFVGNVPVEAEKKDLMKFFMKYGKIESIRFRNMMRKDLTKPLKASAIKKDLHPLCKTMNAYIVFEEEKCAIRALKRNGKTLLGGHLRVDLASSVTDREPNRKCSIFVGNAPFDAQEEGLREHFSACGDIINVRLIRDKETRLGKGFGYVEFKNTDGVSLALQMDGQKFGKNKLRVQRCLKHTKKDGNDLSGQSRSWAGATADRQKKFKQKGKKLPEGKRPKKLKDGKMKQPKQNKVHSKPKGDKNSNPNKSRKSMSNVVKKKPKSK